MFRVQIYLPDRYNGEEPRVGEFMTLRDYDYRTSGLKKKLGSLGSLTSVTSGFD